MFTKSFRNLSKNDVAIAGGKGASLGEMTQAGIPVPLGFVVLSSAFERFVEETDLNVEIDTQLHKVDHNIMHTVEEASEKIQSLILNMPMPEDIADEVRKEFEKLDTKYVAVRSSATAEDSSCAAWAGQLDSFLNTTQHSLLENVRRCWASLFTPRAIFYRFEQNLYKQKISVAVVVQKMVKSEKSGIAFSVHPVTQDRNQLIIEAGYGLGEAIVSGSITPDGYVVEKEPRQIIDKNINTQERMLVRVEGGGNEWQDISKEEGEKPVLSDEQIMEFTDLILKIEDHYDFPCDIEWVFGNGEFCITQSRPITTLSDVEDKTEKNIEVLDFVKNNKFQKQFVYSFLPVFYFESANYCYINNPLKQKLSIKKFPNFIVLFKDNYEDWGGSEIQKIKNKKQIWFIIDENRKVVKKHKEKVSFLLKIKYKKITNQEIIKILKEIDEISTEVYHRYIYLIHDYLETADEELIKLLPEVRIEMSEFVDKIYKSCDYIIDALAEKFDSIVLETFMYATFDEIIHLLENPETINEFKKIHKRPISFVFDGKKLFIVKGEDETMKIVDVLENQSQNVDFNVDKLKGDVVFKGKVKGEVVKVSEFEYEKADKVLKDKEDYVLVTPMTRPEFVPYLNKCRAIVTDEGGITCHAAIVSRELKKPCIVGTKIATQVLKDGDLVEVDADNGVVRILYKEKNKENNK